MNSETETSPPTSVVWEKTSEDGQTTRIWEFYSKPRRPELVGIATAPRGRLQHIESSHVQGYRRTASASSAIQQQRRVLLEVPSGKVNARHR